MNIINQKAFQFGILGVVFFTVSTILAGFQFENYSHTSQLISESYAIDTHYGIYIRLFGFIPSGVFILLFAVHASKQFSTSKKIKLGYMLFGIFYGFATVVVSIFPCDAGCNQEFIDPSASQLIHNMTGLLTYLIVPVSILLLGFEFKKELKYSYLSRLSLFFGILSLAFVLLSFSVINSPSIGLIQRITEGSILLWILFVSFRLRKMQTL